MDFFNNFPQKTLQKLNKTLVVILREAGWYYLAWPKIIQAFANAEMAIKIIAPLYLHTCSALSTLNKHHLKRMEFYDK